MSVTNLVRKAKPVNVREAQAQLSKLIRSKSPTMVLSHGKPVSFLVPYEDMLNNVSVSFPAVHLAGISICGHGTCPVPRVSKNNHSRLTGGITVAFLSRSVYTSDP